MRQCHQRLSCCLFITSLVILTYCHDININSHDNILYNQFYDFAVRFKKEYLADNNTAEMLTRFNTFKENLLRVKYLNEPYTSSGQPVYGVNKFSDLTPQEFQDRYLSGLKRNQWVRQKFSRPALKSGEFKYLPEKIDWREKGVVTSIRDQGKCGACWAFTIVETMESIYGITFKVANSSLPRLSVQQLIDCDSGNNGCEGGDICEACKWSQLKGVVDESLYPLTDHTDKCKTIPDSKLRIFIQNYTCVSLIGQETEILRLLAEHGPVGVAVDATTWHNYIGGIIQFHCSNKINHAVQIVGYDLTGDVPYYIIRNSWGVDFGDHGFMYIKIGENLCGIADEVSYFNVTDYH